MKAIDQYIAVVLCMLYKVVLVLSLWMKPLSLDIQMEATDQYITVVLCMLQALCFTFVVQSSAFGSTF